jgi:hypothetical protein
MAVAHVLPAITCLATEQDQSLQKTAGPPQRRSDPTIANDIRLLVSAGREAY